MAAAPGARGRGVQMSGVREIYRRGAVALGRFSPSLSATEIVAGTVVALATLAAIVTLLLMATG